MASQEKKIINVETEIKGLGKPFQWGDEIKSPEEKPKLEDESHSYTSVSELLEDEDEIEKKRLEEYFKNCRTLKSLNKSSIIDPSGKPTL